MPMQNLQNLRVGNPHKAPVRKHGTDRLTVSARPAFKRMDHRQRRLAFAQV